MSFPPIERFKQLNSGGIYTKTFSVKNEYFVFVYMEAMRRLHQYVSTRNVARYCNY